MEIAGLAVVVESVAFGLVGATVRQLASLGTTATIFDLNEKSGSAHAKAIGGLDKPQEHAPLVESIERNPMSNDETIPLIGVIRKAPR